LYWAVCMTKPTHSIHSVNFSNGYIVHLLLPPKSTYTVGSSEDPRKIPLKTGMMCLLIRLLSSDIVQVLFRSHNLADNPSQLLFSSSSLANVNQS
jgi:hypothetical protein